MDTRSNKLKDDTSPVKLHVSMANLKFKNWYNIFPTSNNEFLNDQNLSTQTSKVWQIAYNWNWGKLTTQKYEGLHCNK